MRGAVGTGGRFAATQPGAVRIPRRGHRSRVLHCDPAVLSSTVLPQPLVQRFELLRELGRGANGVVYEAIDRQQGLSVAIKHFAERDGELLSRFKREFRARADLHHENLVEFYELLASDDSWLLVMELLAGRDLRQYLAAVQSQAEGEDTRNTASRPVGRTSRPTPTTVVDRQQLSGATAPETAPEGRGSTGPWSAHLPVGTLCSLLAGVARGISALHQAGMVHRDIKPSNIMITGEGRPVVIDFGIVADLRRSGRDRAACIGTPAYMAPEQVLGAEVAPPADWFAFGLLLFELLTGERPWQGRSPEATMELRLHQPAPLPSTRARGIPPDLDRLCVALLERDPARRPGVDAILELLEPSCTRSLPPLVVSATRPDALPFIGRTEVLSRLRELFGATRAGRPAVAVVDGAPGMGKTAVAARFLEEHALPAGALVLRGRCYQDERTPYKGLDGAMEELAEHLDQLRRDSSGMLPSGGDELARLFPCLQRHVGMPAGDAAADPHAQRRAALRAWVQLFRDLTRHRSVVLFIDDVQWVSQDSAALLAALLAAPGRPPLFLLLTCRSEDDRGSPVLQQLAEVRREHPGFLLEFVGIDDLPPADAGQLASVLLGNAAREDEVAAIVREARGRPYFIGELARYLSEHGGAAGALRLDEVLTARLAQLAAVERRLLELLAVSGGPLPEEVAVAATGVAAADRLALVHRLRKTCLLRAQGDGRLDLFHDQLREALLRGVTEPQRRGHAERVLAQLLRASRPDWAALFRHARNAGATAEAARYAERAAEAAYAALAFPQAAEFYREALLLHDGAPADRRRLEEALAGALASAGHCREAAALYAILSESAQDVERKVLARKAAEQYLVIGDLPAGTALLERALAAHRLRVPRTMAGALCGIAAGRAQRLWPRGRRAAAGAEGMARIEACYAASIGLAFVDIVRSAYFAEQQLRLCVRAGDPQRLGIALCVAGVHAAAQGARSQSDRLLARGRALHAAHPSRHGDAVEALALGLRAVLLSNWPGALPHLQRAASLSETLGDQWEKQWAATMIATALSASHIHMGDYDLADQVIGEALRSAEARGDLLVQAVLRTTGASLVWLVRDQPQQLCDTVERSLARLPRNSSYYQHAEGTIARVEALVYDGALDRAVAILREIGGWRRERLILQLMHHRIRRVYIESVLALRLAFRGDRAARQQARARRGTRLLRRLDDPWASLLAALLDASLARLRGDTEQELYWLSAARSLAENAAMALEGHAAAHRIGEIVGGERGAALRAAAQEWLHGHGARVPAKLMGLVLPGPPCE
jgi:serine/threonine protein kinase